MSALADAVRKAYSEGQMAKTPEKKPRGVFPIVLAVVLLAAAAITVLYFYEESKISLLNEELLAVRMPVEQLRSQNEVLHRQKTALEGQINSQSQEYKQRVDELLGKLKINKYEKETLESDNIQKENKIAELESAIEKQYEKELYLMSLIEDAKQQIVAQNTALTAAKNAGAGKTSLSDDVIETTAEPAASSDLS